MVRAWFLAAVAFFAIVAGGCKVRERTAISTASTVETASEAHRDSVRVVTRDRVIFRTDTLTVREVVREYGAPLLVRDTVYITPLVRETTRETEQGARLAWQEKADSLAHSASRATLTTDEKLSTDTKTDRATNDRSGWYLTLIALGALALILYFLGKRIDKWKLLE